MTERRDRAMSNFYVDFGPDAETAVDFAALVGAMDGKHMSRRQGSVVRIAGRTVNALRQLEAGSDGFIQDRDGIPEVLMGEFAYPLRPASDRPGPGRRKLT